MGRSPCCDKVGLKKGPWTPEEDQKLLAYIEQHGHGSWRSLPLKAGLQRCGKSCRLRWTNYLRPDIKRGKFSLQEEQTIIQLHALLGNRWSAIATHLPKRTDNEIKNYWNTHLKKRLMKMGIDPVTHKPKSDALVSNNSSCSSNLIDGHSSKSAANLSHMAQWESARLEAEARLVRESRLRSNPFQTPHHQQLLLPETNPNHEMTGGLLFGGPADLESPSSTTLSFPGPVVSVSESRCSEYLLESSCGEVKETWTPESLREDHEDHHAFNNNVIHNNNSAEAGFTELLLSNTAGGCQEDEDNKNYWNTILDLVNTSPAHDSPIF
uniref:Uncharacterized protein n=1 Tax=Kalanchoe fedtschenkoi TaxID=63787 RepID=A0A7N0ZSN3_KALFE